ncbi:sensor histidine kinase [Paenibacillus sp. strain BS8-2]
MSLVSFKNNTLYLFLGCRWALLVVTLLVYAIQYGSHLSEAGLAIAAIACLTFYSLAMLHTTEQKQKSVAIIAADLLAGAILLYAADSFTYALLCYGLSGLLILKLYIGRKLFHVIAVSYILLLPIVAYQLSQSSSLPYVTDTSEYWVLVLIFYIVVWIEGRASSLVIRHLRSLARIYASTDTAPNLDLRLPEAIARTEKSLRSLLQHRDLWLCLDSPLLRERDKSIQHIYYAQRLAEHPPIIKSGYIQSFSPVGEQTELYVQALQDASRHRYGWLILKTDERKLSWMDIVYIRLTLVKFAHQYEMGNRFAAMQEQAVALERDAIAQDIHDGIAQELFFQSIKLFQLKKVLQQDHASSAIDIVTEMEGKVKENHRQIREFIEELKGEKRKFNLQDAVESLLHRIVDGSGVELTFQLEGWVAKEKIEIEEAIYHLIEEAANNVLKHASARQLFVKLEVTSVQWTVLVQDDGKGMDTEAASIHGKLGIKGMKNRIETLNGLLFLQSDSGRGTTVKAVIPRRGA